MDYDKFRNNLGKISAEYAEEWITKLEEMGFKLKSKDFSNYWQTAYFDFQNTDIVIHCCPDRYQGFDWSFQNPKTGLSEYGRARTPTGIRNLIHKIYESR